MHRNVVQTLHFVYSVRAVWQAGGTVCPCVHSDQQWTGRVYMYITPSVPGIDSAIQHKAGIYDKLLIE